MQISVSKGQNQDGINTKLILIVIGKKHILVNGKIIIKNHTEDKESIKQLLIK
ncbi:3719_t:CDS:2 [Entrophospora sp. SA101]|nr:3719_t:CDS:2 [Entrophospora sp. SA101]